MAEKSFREIEAAIDEKGFKALLNEGAEEIQNITRTLGYLRDRVLDDIAMIEEIDGACGSLIRSAMALLDLADEVDE